MKALVIVPAYNEEKNISNVIADINEMGFDYIVINDCSRDATKDVLRHLDANYIDLPVNLGIGGAVQTGYKYALACDYDIAIQVDGDGQHDISYLPEIIKIIEDGKADIVIGSRFLEKEGFQSSRVRRMGIRFFNRLITLVCGITITDATSGYRAVNRRFIEIYSRAYPTDYPEPEAIVAAAICGGKVSEIPVVMKERENGTSSIDFWKSIYYMVAVSLAILVCRASVGRKSSELLTRKTYGGNGERRM